MKRILIVHNYYQIPGGEDTVVDNEKRLLENYGHTVVLYTRDNAELKAMSKIKKMSLVFTTIYNPQTVKDISKIIKDNNIDIVHVHNTLGLISPSVYYVARSYKIPIVQTVHNFRLLCPGATFYRDGHICEDCVMYGLRCAVKHSCYRKSKLQTLACVISTSIHRMTGIYGKINYICLTEFNKEKLLTLRQIKKEKIFIKPNFIDNSNGFIPGRKRVDQFIFAGRLDKLKGIDILLEAWKKMGNSAPKLILCGTGPMEKWCQEFIKRNRIYAELKGFLPNTEVKSLLAKSKALMLPTQWYEGFPMSIVESYSVGTPVICNDLGNVSSIVINGVTGWKFRGIDELIDCVKKIQQEDLGFRTYHEYISKYTGQINYEVLMSIYESLV